MSFLTLPSDLISVDLLAENINNEKLILLDASWFMPVQKRDGKAEWAEETIPSALFFDFDKEICDKDNDLPHMMPSEANFQGAVRRLGINQNSAIIVFDRLGIFSSPRVWWMFKSMGFNNIAVLDGGLPLWKELGHPVCAGATNDESDSSDFVANFQANLICDEQMVLRATEDEQVQIVDARPEARFLGQVAEPRADLRSGHMPSAKNLPFANIIKNGQLIESELLKATYDSLIENDKSTIFSCGSGVTACVLALGATLCGYKNLTVFDGSWSQWGADTTLPVVK